MTEAENAARRLLVAEAFEGIRAEYAQLLKEIVERAGTVPAWLTTAEAGCACGDKCSTGSTAAERLTSKVLPQGTARTLE